LAKSSIGIEGMSCAACVRRVEEGIRSLPGVTDVAVNFATSRATVEFDPAVTGEGAIRRRIVEIGYGAPEAPAESGLRKAVILVGGMTCAACVRRVENA